MGRPGGKDVLGTSVGDYGKRFVAALGAPGGGGSGASGAPGSGSPLQAALNLYNRTPDAERPQRRRSASAPTAQADAPLPSDEGVQRRPAPYARLAQELMRAETSAPQLRSLSPTARIGVFAEIGRNLPTVG